MKKHLQPLTPAALYARVSSDRQDVDLSVSAQLTAARCVLPKLDNVLRHPTDILQGLIEDPGDVR